MTVNADRCYSADEILMFDSDGRAVFRFEPVRITSPTDLSH